MKVAAEAVLDVLRQLSHDIRDLDVGTSVDRHQKLPVVQFLRDYVAANKPVVLTGVVSHWPAFSNWTDEYLCSVAGDTEVTVALTPNGRADAVTRLPGSGSLCGSSSAAGMHGSTSHSGNGAAADGSAQEGCYSRGQDAHAAATAAVDAAAQAACRQGATGSTQGECFALPHQVKMPLRDFLELLRSSKQGQQSAECSSSQVNGSATAAAVAAAAAPPVVPYLQYQNSSLTAEVPQLLGDVDLLLSWATQAFGGLPEAVNLWIGDERSVTSWHHDPYENVYAVLAGSKTFWLMPPADAFRMRLRRYAQATYKPVQLGGAASPSSDDLDSADAVMSGAVRLEPVLHEPAEEVLWSSVLPDADAAAARAAGPAAHATNATSNKAGSNITSNITSGDPAASHEAANGASDLQERDLFGDPSLPPPLKVTVKAGEALYLPAMWWHQVEQMPDDSGRVIAVNYWYDMKFDARAAYLTAVERLAALLGLNDEPPPPPGPGSATGSDREQREQHQGHPQQLRPPYTQRAAG